MKLSSYDIKACRKMLSSCRRSRLRAESGATQSAHAKLSIKLSARQEAVDKVLSFHESISSLRQASIVCDGGGHNNQNMASSFGIRAMMIFNKAGNH